MKITEKSIEIYLRDRIKKVGGVAFKFISPGNDGVPDRLICLPTGQAIFVELKAPGKTTRPLQDLQIARLKNLNFKVFIIDSKEKVDELLEMIHEKAI
jgi:VRR-NUC domain protein